MAREVLRSALGQRRVRVYADRTMLISELSEESLPAVFFTRKGQNPILVKERSPEGFIIQQWDGRESLCRLGRLERNLQPEGYFPGDSAPDSTTNQRRQKVPLELVKKEMRHLALGMANGATVSLALLLFVYAIFRLFNGTFPGASVSGSEITLVGLLASLLATFAFLQFRTLVSRWFENRSRSLRARQQKLPAPFPIKSLAGVESGRQLVEIMMAPALLIGACLAARVDPGSASFWVIVIGLTLPALVFLTGCPRLIRKWEKARSTGEEASIALVSGTRKESPAIQILNLFLEHPDESRSPLIDGVSLKIQKREKVGVFGKLSSGITILFQVISGLLEADHGVVWIDGKIVSGNNAPDFGWFSEKTSLVSGTLRENLCMGANRDLSTREIKSIAALTGLDQVSVYREHGLDAPLCESGRNISDHDKLRILLTRSLINQPGTLIFQAPRNPEHDASFREILNRYLKTRDCTLLLGVTRIDQLGGIDRTIHFEEGKIVSDGPTDLVDKNLVMTNL